MLAPSFCTFLANTVWTRQIVCPVFCSVSSCGNPWGFQLRRNQRLKSPCWFTGTHADMRILSTCTFGPWKDCACQDGVPTSSWLEPSEQGIWQSQLIPRSTGNNNLLRVSKCLNRILWGLFQFFHAIIFFSSSI